MSTFLETPKLLCEKGLIKYKNIWKLQDTTQVDHIFCLFSTQVLFLVDFFSLRQFLSYVM